MIHAPKSKLTLFQKLKTIEPKRPTDAGEYWVGIKHSDLLRAICAACADRGWTASPQAAALSNDEQDLVAYFKIHQPHDAPEFLLGVITSNARRHALKFFVGYASKEHDFETVLGEVFIGQKREGATEEFDLRQKIKEALNEVDTLAKAIPGLLKLWAMGEYTDLAVAHLVRDVGRNKILPWSRVGILDQYAQRRRQTNQPIGPLDMLRAFTHAVQHSPPLNQPEQLNEFRKLIHARINELGE